MADQVLHVPIFGGGIVLTGAPDTQRTDELAACDGYDITPRGQLVAASDRSDWLALRDTATVPVAPTRLAAIAPWPLPGADLVVMVGEGTDGAVPDPKFFVWLAERTGATSPLPANHGRIVHGYYQGAAITADPAPFSEGAQVTIVVPPGQYKYVPPGRVVPPASAYILARLAFVNIGAREGKDAQLAPGLYVLVFDDDMTTVLDITLYASSGFDMLGKGRFGDAAATAAAGPAGITNAQQMRFRGIAFYNGHLMGWGQRGTVDYGGGYAALEEDAARLAFSSVTTPLVFGNTDKLTPTTLYSDTDAIIVGETGEAIRAGVQWGRKFMIGTNKGLHYLEGYGRDTFLTDRSTAIASSENVLGPEALIVGPDGLLHGVGSRGHWTFDGSAFKQHYRKLVRFDDRSLGYWDLLWTDASRGTAYPGQTNCDLVWMVVDKPTQQVVIGIPWCNATNGTGYGTDTVVLKFHCETGGYTRQTFTGVQLTAAAYLDRDSRYKALALLGTATAGVTSMQEYRKRVAETDSPKLPTALGTVTFGEYADFGPDGVGVYSRGYLTVAWENQFSPPFGYVELPLVFRLTPTVDDVTGTAVKVTIDSVAPGAPADGDMWVDTSATDTNLGNASAGALVPASATYLVKRYVTTWAKWVLVPGGGQQGRRVTIPIGFKAMRGTRLKVKCDTLTATARWSIEGFGTRPAQLRSGK